MYNFTPTHIKAHLWISCPLMQPHEISLSDCILLPRKDYLGSYAFSEIPPHPVLSSSLECFVCFNRYRLALRRPSLFIFWQMHSLCCMLISNSLVMGNSITRFCKRGYRMFLFPSVCLAETPAIKETNERTTSKCVCVLRVKYPGKINNSQKWIRIQTEKPS